MNCFTMCVENRRIIYVEGHTALYFYTYEYTYIYIYLFMVTLGSHFLVHEFGCMNVNIYIRRFNSIEPLLAPGLCLASGATAAAAFFCAAARRLAAAAADPARSGSIELMDTS